MLTLKRGNDAIWALLPVVQSLLCLVRCKICRKLLPNNKYRCRHLPPRVPITQLNFFQSFGGAGRAEPQCACASSSPDPPPDNPKTLSAGTQKLKYDGLQNHLATNAWILGSTFSTLKWVIVLMCVVIRVHTIFKGTWSVNAKQLLNLDFK